MFSSGAQAWSEYLECSAKGGPVQQARFLLSAESMGGMIFTANDGPISYLDGRDEEKVELFSQPDGAAFVLRLYSLNHAVPRVVAFIQPQEDQTRFFDLTLYFEQNGSVTLERGRCALIGR